MDRSFLIEVKNKLTIEKNLKKNSKKYNEMS